MPKRLRLLCTGSGIDVAMPSVGAECISLMVCTPLAVHGSLMKLPLLSTQWSNGVPSGTVRLTLVPEP